MQLCHTPSATSAVFDDPNLVSSAGLVPVLALGRSAGLHELAQQHLSVPTDKGANAGLKVASLVAGMVAGADSIDDLAPSPCSGPLGARRRNGAGTHVPSPPARHHGDAPHRSSRPGLGFARDRCQRLHSGMLDRASTRSHRRPLTCGELHV